MKNVYIFLLGMLFYSLTATAQTKIVAIGSSTVSGEGASVPDSAWINRLNAYYSDLGISVTIVNLGYPQTTTFNGMPSSYLPPSRNLSPDTPFYGHNITYVWQYHPDIVIIAYPSNDIVLGFTVPQFLANLRTIRDSVQAQGKIAWVATTQPRNDIPTNERQQQLEAKDSILSEFAGHVFNFWDPLADPTTLGFKAGLTNDAIHPDDAGHALLFQAVKNANIINTTPLPINIVSFAAVEQSTRVLLSWTTAGEETGSFIIQRSGDGAAFSDIGQAAAVPSSSSYSWTDVSPVGGRAWYRLHFTGKEDFYSPVVTLGPEKGKLSIDKVYSPDGKDQLIVELNTGGSPSVQLSVFSAGGIPVIQTPRLTDASSTKTLDISRLAAGQYFIRLSDASGHFVTTAFSKF